jgi:hypothetical protein
LRLFDLPLLDAPSIPEHAKEPLDIRAPQVTSPATALAPVKELANPVRVEPAPPFFNPHLFEHLKIALRPTRAGVVFRHLASLAGLLFFHSRHLRSLSALDNIDIPTAQSGQASINPAHALTAACRPLLSIAGWEKRVRLAQYFTNFGVAFHGTISHCQATSVG